MASLVIPGYRLRAYALFCTLLFLGGCIGLGSELFDAVSLGHFETSTGPRSHRLKEHLAFEVQPLRFTLYLLYDAAMCLVSGVLGSLMAWVVLRGRRALKHWPAGF